MTIEEMREEFSQRKGYGPHFNSIDRDVVREAGPCGCGGRMLYVGFKHAHAAEGRTTEYHAVMYCAKCGEAEEF